MSDGQRHSLAARAAAALRTRLAALRAQVAPAVRAIPIRSDWRIPALVALLLAMGPIATILGAKLLTARAEAEAHLLAASAAPRVAADTAFARDRADLGAVVHRPGVGVTIEAIARALPPEASLTRAERRPDGLLEIEVRAPDPDKLRAALRREPALAGLHDVDQRHDDTAMRVTLAEQP